MAAQTLKSCRTILSAASLAELICRPEMNYELLKEIDPEREEKIASYIKEAEDRFCLISRKLFDSVIEQVEIEIKYEGYILRQNRQVDQYKKMEKKKIPDNIDYDDVSSLRLEARQKLKEFRPISVGQASRISGVSPADVSMLMIYLNI